MQRKCVKSSCAYTEIVANRYQANPTAMAMSANANSLASQFPFGFIRVAIRWIRQTASRSTGALYVLENRVAQNVGCRHPDHSGQIGAGQACHQSWVRRWTLPSQTPSGPDNHCCRCAFVNLCTVFFVRQCAKAVRDFVHRQHNSPQLDPPDGTVTVGHGQRLYRLFGC